MSSGGGGRERGKGVSGSVYPLVVPELIIRSFADLLARSAHGEKNRFDICKSRIIERREVMTVDYGRLYSALFFPFVESHRDAGDDDLLCVIAKNMAES